MGCSYVEQATKADDLPISYFAPLMLVGYGGVAGRLFAYYICPSVRACVRESGRSREAIRPVLKNFPFFGSLELDATQKSPLT